VYGLGREKCIRNLVAKSEGLRTLEKYEYAEDNNKMYRTGVDCGNVIWI
jgi:hypothetical protein